MSLIPLQVLFMAYRYKKRTFLNKDTSKSAHVIAIVEKSDIDKETGKLWGATANLDIMDCNRKVSLDFGMYDKKDVAESLNKLDNLIVIIENFKKALVAEGEFITNYVEPPKNPKKKASKKA